MVTAHLGGTWGHLWVSYLARATWRISCGIGHLRFGDHPRDFRPVSDAAATLEARKGAVVRAPLLESRTSTPTNSTPCRGSKRRPRGRAVPGGSFRYDPRGSTGSTRRPTARRTIAPRPRRAQEDPQPPGLKTARTKHGLVARTRQVGPRAIHVSSDGASRRKRLRSLLRVGRPRPGGERVSRRRGRASDPEDAARTHRTASDRRRRLRDT